MNKPLRYDETPVAGDFRELPPEGYICTVLKAEERTNRNGGLMLVLFLDIAEGEYAGYFKNLWKERKLNRPTETVKYPNSGTAYINVLDREGNTSRTFKAVTTAIEKSGGRIAWGNAFCENLKGAKLGVIFGREEYEWQGEYKWSIKPRIFRSVETIQSGDYTIPADKFLERNDYAGTGFTPVSTLDSFSEALDDIPFGG